MMPSSKRAGDDVEALAGGTKKKGGGAGRTGQACDRCKIRKIRCDARPGGCSPCIQNSSECKTTDRITGRANARGHAESLENENASLRMYMVELQQQLRENGVEPKAPPSIPEGYVPAQPYWGQDEQQQGSWGDLNNGNGLMKPTIRTERKGSVGSMLPEFRAGCIGDNYLGVSSGNNWLSPIEGTSLALFGMKLDVTEFLPAETDPTAAPMSYKTFLAYAFGKKRLSDVPPLPSYDDCKQYAEWYFKSIQIFTPVLHRPDFMKLLTSIFHEQYQPNAAETVMVHMVISMLKFQYYCRNGVDQMRSESMKHYHHALSFIPDLITGHTLQDIQALVLICEQLRNQPRPGAAWMFINAVFGLVVEVGLHRSASNWQGSAAERDSHTIEMRKRIFWTTMVLHVNIGGKLGRPMPIRLEDFDIEIPEAQADNMPEEKHLSKWRKCSWRAAVPGFKLLKIVMQVYSTVYSIRSGTESYDMNVRNIEKQLDNFREQLPAELAGGPETVEEDRCPALYLRHNEELLRLILHHPSLYRSMSPRLMADNLDACLDASRKLLSTSTQLKDLNSLDTTWMLTTDFLAAIFTTLFIYSQRQDQMSSVDLQRLRQDMKAWLEVMGDAGKILGAGFKLRDAVKGIIGYSLSNISRNIAAKTASATLASTSSSESPKEEHSQQDGTYTTPGEYSNTYTNGAATTEVPDTSRESYSVINRGSEQQQQEQFPPTNGFYSDPRTGAVPSYAPGNMPAFDMPSYSRGDMKPSVQVPNPAMTPSGPHHSRHNSQIAQHQVPGSFAPAFHSQPNHNGYHAAAQAFEIPDAGQAAWRNFADSMMTTIGGTDFMNSASAFMAMGNDNNDMDMPGPNFASIGGLQIPHNAQQAWPLLQYAPNPVHRQQ